MDTGDKFNSLAMQPWPSNIFHELNKDQAVFLLKGLYDANTACSFLTVSARTATDSVLSSPDIKSQRNFNVLLLLTILQRNSEETQRSAERAVDELRKKAVTMEQTERAELARAASAYAIASGNLDLYGETVTWQQRFARDPPSVRFIFGRGSVMTSEGIELLSGIPHPLPGDEKLAEVASRVKKANDILKKFHETVCIAKREPSYRKSDWTAVTSLFQAAINQRVARAKDIQNRLLGSEVNAYITIWSDTLSMLGKIDVDFFKEAFWLIKNLLETLPPTALAATTKIVLEVGDEKRRNTQSRQLGDDLLERLSYELLKCLARSEKPELAQPLILQTIIGRPDASSWHRKLLPASFMNRLPAKDANDLLRAFANRIAEKLEEQSYIKVGEEQPRQSAPPQSLVKVTTVKYLAQVLENAQFVSTDTAVDILVELFKVGTHRDIRLATLGSLLSFLSNLCSGADESWRSNASVEKILGALEMINPALGSVNERRPPLPEDWEEAIKSGVLPELADVSAGLPPLLKIIFTANYAWQYPGLNKLRVDFISRLLLPILELSQAEHRKWILLFLAKHNANLTVDDFPPTPITPEIWKFLVNGYLDLIPRTVLEDYNRYTIMTIAPPTALKDFNNSLRHNPDLRDNAEVRHWLFVLGQSMNSYGSSGTKTLVNIIKGDSLSPSPINSSGITFNRVLGMIVEHASLFLDDYEKYTAIWKAFVTDLQPPTKSTYPSADADFLRSKVSTWQRTGKVILEKIIDLLLDKKKKNIQEHNHSILPSLRPLRLWLLTYPCFPSHAELDRECQNFAQEIEELLDYFLQGEPNVLLRWPELAKDFCTISPLLNTTEERLRIALRIGGLVSRSISESSTISRHQKASALNYVRITLAVKLIDDGRDGLAEKTGTGELMSEVEQEREKEKRLVKRRIWNMVQEWQKDVDEGIREKVAEWRSEQNDTWKVLASNGIIA